MEVQSTEGKRCFILFPVFPSCFTKILFFVKHGYVLKPDGWFPDEHDLVENYGDQPWRQYPIHTLTVQDPCQHQQAAYPIHTQFALKQYLCQHIVPNPNTFGTIAILFPTSALQRAAYPIHRSVWSPATPIKRVTPIWRGSPLPAPPPSSLPLD